MINVKELRIGNAVFKKDALFNGKDMQIKERLYFISAYDIYHMVEDGDPTNHPIPLTPEWLERCGGIKNIGTPFYCIDMPSNIGQIHINPGNGMIWLKHHRNEHTSLNPYSGNAGYYLHNLQNLYFALTGEELTIKELA